MSAAAVPSAAGGPPSVSCTYQPSSSHDAVSDGSLSVARSNKLSAAQGFSPTNPNSDAAAPVQFHTSSSSQTPSVAAVIRLDGSLPDGSAVFPVKTGSRVSSHAPHGKNIVEDSQPPHVAASAAIPKDVHAKSYADTIKTRRPADAFVTNLTEIHPVKNPNGTLVRMPEKLYESRLSSFHYAFIGRLVLPKGSSPISLPALKAELSHLFQITGWNLVILGKRFYSLKFASSEDQRKAAKFTTWKLQTGLFHLRDWKPDFNPYREHSSIAQIWVRLFHLPEEYWHPEFLVGIFRAAGNVIKLDGNTVEGLVGHFARALVEVDMAAPLAEVVTIARGSFSFPVEFGYESLPLFCTFCKFIGHTMAKCNHARKKEEEYKNDSHEQSHRAGGGQKAE